jgi:hypothetical protein
MPAEPGEPAEVRLAEERKFLPNTTNLMASVGHAWIVEIFNCLRLEAGA